MSTAVQSKKSRTAARHGAIKPGRLDLTAAASRIGRNRKVIHTLPLSKLAPLAARLAATENDKVADSLRKQFLEGYYGKPVRLPNAQTAAV